MRHILSILVASILIIGCGTTNSPTAQPTTVPTINPEANQANLIGSRWNVLTINGQPLVGQNALPFTIESASTVSGNSGCNSYGGPISIDGSTMQIGPLVSTLMACADNDVQTQEIALLRAFEQVRSYQQTDANLSLLDEQGTVVVTLAKQP
ncbi:META domain-containing protein [Herpetosiphon giganteus]|uniref:META domain-containing protein n=1 Tax=Herpetosiphon giganteus TaxID=2029754 RepID=UPI00195A5950|nr:META domain-containing protein [Herpetosiphon giganteus]MBM7845172.1 heat shock protein HslJ [Herpetosiphon giganteus]